MIVEDPKYGAPLTQKDLAAAYIGKGDIYAAQDKYQEALEAYEQALRLNPGDERAFRGRKLMKDILFPPSPPPPAPYPASSSPYGYPGSQPEYVKQPAYQEPPTHPGQLRAGLPTQPQGFGP